MPKAFLPGEDLAIIGGYMIGLTDAETSRLLGRTVEGVRRRRQQLRENGFLLPKRAPGPDPDKRREYYAFRDGLKAAEVYPLPIGPDNLAAYARACQGQGKVHYGADPDAALNGADFG